MTSIMPIFNENGCCVNSIISYKTSLEQAMSMANETIIFENSFSQVIDSIVTGIKKFIRKIIDFFDTAITSIKNKFDKRFYNIKRNKNIIISKWKDLSKEEQDSILEKYKSEEDITEVYDICNNMCDIKFLNANDLNMKIANSVMELHGVIPMANEIYKISVGYNNTAMEDATNKATNEAAKLRGALLNCNKSIEKDGYEDCVKQYFIILCGKFIYLSIDDYTDIASGKLSMNIDKFKSILREFESEVDSAQYKADNSNNKYLNIKLSFMRECLNTFFIYSSYMINTYKVIIKRSTSICEETLRKSS